MKSAFDKIAAGLEDAVAYTNGDKARGREATFDVKAVRTAAKQTQADFARAYRVPVATVRDWEQGRRVPDSASLTFLKMIEADADGVARIIAKID